MKSVLYHRIFEGKPFGHGGERRALQMQEIDKYFTEHPTTGRQGMTDHLKMIGYTVNIKRVSRLMDKMGLEAIYPKKCLSKMR